MTTQPHTADGFICRRAMDTDTVPLGILVLEGLLQSPSAEQEPSEMPSDPQTVGEDLLMGAIERSDAILMVAEIAGRLAAVARISPRDLVHARHVGDLQLLVHPDARAQGVATELLMAMAVEARTTGALKLAMRIADDDRGLQSTAARCGWRRERLEQLALRRGEELHDVEVWALDLGDAAPHAS